MITLENVETLLNKIDQAKIDSEVIECYQSGIVALKQVFKETGLNEETVLSTMEELEDELNKINEVEEALSKPLDKHDEQNLEDELNEILLEKAPPVPENIEIPEENKKIDKDIGGIKKKMEALSI